MGYPISKLASIIPGLVEIQHTLLINLELSYNRHHRYIEFMVYWLYLSKWGVIFVKIVYASTPDFGIPTLDRLSNLPHSSICGVITQPDRKKGRGQQVLFSPIR